MKSRFKDSKNTIERKYLAKNFASSRPSEFQPKPCLRKNDRALATEEDMKWRVIDIFFRTQ